MARERVARILTQKAGDTDKLYALHAPEVECFAKGKARTRYEFGVKTSCQGAPLVGRAQARQGQR